MKRVGPPRECFILGDQHWSLLLTGWALNRSVLVRGSTCWWIHTKPSSLTPWLLCSKGHCVSTGVARERGRLVSIEWVIWSTWILRASFLMGRLCSIYINTRISLLVLILSLFISLSPTSPCLIPSEFLTVHPSLSYSGLFKRIKPYRKWSEWLFS